MSGIVFLKNLIHQNYKIIELQAYHRCEDKLIASYLCTNGTLFNEQFQVCDQFYNVRCGSSYSDL